MAVTDNGWLFAHGDFQPQPMRGFLRGNGRMLRTLQASADLRRFEALSVACNATWAAHVLYRGGNRAMTDRLVKFSDWEVYRRDMRSGKLPVFPFSVLHGRTLAELGDKGCGEKTPACSRTVGEVQQLLALDWTTQGGIALGHTVQSSMSDACGKTVYLTDVGMSEAFFGVNGSPVAFMLVETRERVRQVEVSARTGKRRDVEARPRDADTR